MAIHGRLELEALNQKILKEHASRQIKFDRRDPEADRANESVDKHAGSRESRLNREASLKKAAVGHNSSHP